MMKNITSLHVRIHYNAEPQPAHVVLSNILLHSLAQPVVAVQNKSSSPRSVHHCTTQISTTYIHSNKMHHSAFTQTLCTYIIMLFPMSLPQCIDLYFILFTVLKYYSLATQSLSLLNTSLTICHLCTFDYII